MFGSVTGNLVAAVYFLLFQILGIQITFRIIREESISFRILIGSVLGSFSLQWLPALFSFFIGFHKNSHFLAIIAMIIIGIIVFNLVPIPKLNRQDKPESHKGIWFILMPTFLFVVAVLYTHTIRLKGGAIYTGQNTFGDMNLHLGIITSIANQGKFPPEYSIFPGVKLAYPFLSDSISSSLYLFGASLRFAYLFPMLFAFLQVFYGFYLFAFGWLRKQSSAILAWIFFFFNGGFGVFYFMDGLADHPYNFTRMFTEFYETPTNLFGSNIRWVNVIVDMLIPQRATLFGYAILFSVLCLLYKGVFEQKTSYFILSAVFLCGLPMIHTHSFLTGGIICAVWCLYTLYQRANKNSSSYDPRTMVIYCVAGILFMEAVHLLKNWLTEKTLLMIPVFVLIMFTVYGLYLLYKNIVLGQFQYFLKTWGVFLFILVIPVSWQLFTWTFQQAAAGQFVKGHFNWGNEMDSYLWFYIKNMGVAAILTIPALIKAGKKNFIVFSPALLIWFITEFIVFQPNTYDNNKLLYPAYGFLCCLLAFFISNLLHRINSIINKRLLITGVLILATTSAILTMIREINSSYQLYSSEQVVLSQFVEAKTPVDSIIMTDTRHNNAISCLTGRNILCGTGSFLYYHGIDYAKREQEIRLLYEDVTTYGYLLEDYAVDYILVGPEERYSYPNLNETLLMESFLCVYQKGDISLYAVSERAKSIIY